ncbi:hypothetical protein D3C77_515090 [compost metagenome]
MTPQQQKRFDRLCKEMGTLLAELTEENSDITLFLEDGYVALYDWPSDQERRPEDPLSASHYWPGSSGGGR